MSTMLVISLFIGLNLHIWSCQEIRPTNIGDYDFYSLTYLSVPTFFDRANQACSNQVIQGQLPVIVSPTGFARLKEVVPANESNLFKKYILIS